MAAHTFDVNCTLTVTTTVQIELDSDEFEDFSEMLNEASTRACDSATEEIERHGDFDVQDCRGAVAQAHPRKQWMVCLDCEEEFAGDEDSLCPACGSGKIRPVGDDSEDEGEEE
jgi:hypothetical protein